MSNKEYLVSVILPVYNSEKYLRKTIESVLTQTHSKIELIIVDDGSTDSSPSICDEYNDERIKVYHKTNGGLSSARQFGIDHSTGAFFCTIDADDYYDKSFVEIMLKKITQNNSDICICNRYDFIDGSDRVYARKEITHQQIIIVDKEMMISNYLGISSKLIMCDSWNKMYRKRFVLDSNVKFDLPAKSIGNDLAFNYKLIMHCPKTIMIDECLLYHRIVEGSMVHKSNSFIQEGFELITIQLFKEAEMTNLNIVQHLSVFYYSYLGVILRKIATYDSNKHMRINVFLDRYKMFYKKGYINSYVYNSKDYKSLAQKIIVKAIIMDYKLLLYVFADIYYLFSNIRKLITKI